MSGFDPRIPPDELARARAMVSAKVTRLRRRRAAAVAGGTAFVCTVVAAVALILLPGSGPKARSVQVTSPSSTTSSTIGRTTTTRPKRATAPTSCQ